MISIIIPFYNEAESLPELLKQLDRACRKINRPYEIIGINDGSSDGFKLKNKYQNLKILEHRKRLGKGQALSTGLKESKGEVVIFMDADLQDDPKDIPQFLKKIDEGYDFINGVRQGRKDIALIRIYSFFANIFLKKIFHSPYTDINCGFKAFKKEVLNDFVFYGNNFRFFPLVVFYQGFKVVEIPVANHSRKYGYSKFGPTKLFIGILDTINTYFIYKFSEQPLHFFGPIGGAMFSIGIIINLYLAYERIFFHVLLYRRPLLLLGIMLTIVGLQIVMTGIITELIVFLNKKNNT